jgi:hypothetical protein
MTTPDPSRSETATCATCPHYRSVLSSRIPGLFGGWFLEVNPWGKCYRYPPQGVFDARPHVRANTWCGEHPARQRPQETP